MSKKQCYAGDNDLITNLDENLLRQILSCLPTKDAVRTSILSKDWRYKWTISYNMVVKNSFVKQDKVSFANFMDRILKYSQPLRSFCLTIYRFPYRSNRVQPWISTALQHRLEVLKIDYDGGATGFVIPSTLLNSTCLRQLRLMFDKSTLNTAAMNCAPKLAYLYISGVNIVNENHNTSTTVKFNFPLLETFKLTKYKWSNVKSVELHAPSLAKFKSQPSDSEGVKYVYSFVILAPRLTIFICSYFPENFILDGSSIVSASFECLNQLPNIGTRVRNLLNEFKNLEELHLNLNAFMAQFGPPLQRHDKLRQLTLPNHRINPELLLQLLYAAPSLKLLRLNVYNWAECDYEAIESVPSCILSHLEEVELKGFHIGKWNYNLVKFLSMNGVKLKKLTMSALSPQMQNEVKRFVSTFRNVEFVFPYADDFY